MDIDATDSAVRHDTDLRRYAILLRRTHEAMVTGDKPPASPREIVTRSWNRMRCHGMNPESWHGGSPVGVDTLEYHRRDSGLVPVLEPLRSSLASVIADTDQLMVITDAEGVVLWREGYTRARLRADKIGFIDGAHWTETTVGTNAIGTALVEATPLQLFSAEHYACNLHSWTCTASPVHDPRTGRLLGVVNVSGPAATAHPAMFALVRTAVRLAEAELWRSHEQRLNPLRALAGSMFVQLSDPAVIVDNDGWVAAVHGVAPFERVATPEPGKPCAIPGVGTCIPEPIPGGWILRAESNDTASMRLRLDQTTTPPSAVVEGATVWRCPLTTRHVELLTLLMRAGQNGISASVLSEHLFGNQDHVVAVRAELSRLRRKLGGLILARPYRIAPNITTCHTGAPPTHSG